MASHDPNMVPHPSQNHIERGYGASTPTRSHLLGTSAVGDFDSAPGNPVDSSPLSQSMSQQNNYGRFNEEWDASQRGSSVVDGVVKRSNSGMSQGETLTPSRGGTLKKKASLKRGNSLKKSSSRRSSRAGSVRSLALQSGNDEDETHSAFYSPVPFNGNPTETLANRFQAWRKVLKDLIQYYREIQNSYEQKGKNVLKVANIANNTITPSIFLQSGGIDDALQVLREYHKTAIAESNKSKEIENDVILALVGLRSDLNQKIKEIKGLSGDFKNSVAQEMDKTRKTVKALQDGLGQSDVDPSTQTGRQDPYLLKLAVDRQVERQIDEENYLHQAYLNLEASGRELEAIVVGEIQKSYNALAGILKREADSAYSTVEELRTGPIAMPKDHEWNNFVEKDDQFIDPRLPVRQPQNIHYPGRDSELAQEVRAGLMERKSKYLKSYTAGWYVLSPTHLHEFKSADKTQAPIMSLFLPEQKLGSHSNLGASSNKFMLKGRQTGSMHRGHSWVFRCESYDTMMAWYEDIKALTEKSPQERNAFVRQHARSFSGTSQRSTSRAGSISSDGIMDEEDEEPFSATSSAVVAQEPKQDVLPRRPQPGGRFPSDVEVSTARGLQVPLSPSSGSSNFDDRKVAAAAAGLPGSGVGQHYAGQHYAQDNSPTHAARINQAAEQDGINPYTSQPVSHINPERRSDVPDSVVVGGAALGGPVLSAASEEAYQERKGDDTDLEDGIQSEHAAVVGPTPSYLQAQSNQAAYEASLIAAPDTDLLGRSSDDHVVAGGRSQGSLACTDTPLTETSKYNSENPAHEILDPLADDIATGKVLTSNNTSVEQAHSSISSISQLHIPGEFPRSSVAS